MIKVLDLYCGAGGLGFGFEMSHSFEVVGGLDIYQPALDSFYRNHRCGSDVEREHSKPTDLSVPHVRTTVIKRFTGVDVVVGGPPCQGFSVAGKRLDDYLQDQRNHQAFNFIEIVAGLRPKAFVMENVRGITTTGQKDKNSILNQLIERYRLLGYQVQWQVLNAEEYFVPQKRRRMFMVGLRSEYPRFTFPAPQCSESSGLFEAAHRYTTVRQAIGDLPDPNDGSNLDYTSEPEGWYRRLMRDGSKGVQAHSITKHSSDFTERLRAQSLGSKLYPKWNHSWVKFHPDSVAPTIKENHRAPGVHYSRPMCISPRECARLQSMPDRFVVCGTKTQRLIQIGNAVPPLLAAAVATAMTESLGVNCPNPCGVANFTSVSLPKRCA